MPAVSRTMKFTVITFAKEKEQLILVLSCQIQLWSNQYQIYIKSQNGNNNFSNNNIYSVHGFWTKQWFQNGQKYSEYYYNTFTYSQLPSNGNP